MEERSVLANGNVIGRIYEDATSTLKANPAPRW
jgi:hypothetical protein